MPAFDPRNPAAVVGWTKSDVDALPNAEDDFHEYKSSATPDSELARKIARAASGFWNSGGGLFVAGVDGTGRADGGIDPVVGRQSRRDWTDQALLDVVPHGSYVIVEVQPDGSSGISSGKVVLVVAFGESHVGPHMAPDKKYYVRTGAHTNPAGHFLVESIRARRAVEQPILRPILRTKVHDRSVFELRVLALTGQPAIDVEMNIDPLPKTMERMTDKLPLRLRAIDRENPFLMDFGVSRGPSASLTPFVVSLKYADLMGRRHEEQFTIDPLHEMASVQIGKSEAEEIKAGLGAIADAIKRQDA